MLFDAHISPFGPAELGGFFPSSCGRILQRENPRSSRLEFLEIFFLETLSLDSAAQAKKTFLFLGVAGGTIERSCYSPHYVNTERDYERDYQATLPQGRTAADGCKPRHGRDDRKRERSFSGLRVVPPMGEPGTRLSPLTLRSRFLSSRP